LIFKFIYLIIRFSKLLFGLRLLGLSKMLLLLILPTESTLCTIILRPEFRLDLLAHSAPLFTLQAMRSDPGPKILAPLAHHHAHPIFVKSLCLIFTEYARHDLEANDIPRPQALGAFGTIIVLVSVDVQSLLASGTLLRSV